MSKNCRMIAYLVILLVAGGGIHLIYQGVVSRRPLPEGTGVVVKTLHTLCGHTENIRPKLPNRQMTLQALRSLYPDRDGWHLSYRKDGVEISKRSETLCSSCRKRTHLGRKGDFLAVIRGPVGVEGGLVRVTPIRLSRLPHKLRAEAEQGRLDLPDEKALLQVLDSLEENSR